MTSQNQLSVEPPEPPAGSVIRITDDTDGRHFEWQPASRHPVEWFAVVAGGMCMVMAAGFMAATLLEKTPSPDDLADPRFRPFADLNPLFTLPHFLMGLYFFQAGWRKGHPENIRLGKATFCYDTGSPLLPTLIGWMFWPVVFQTRAAFGITGSDGWFRLTRKRFDIPLEKLAEFKLERVGGRQRLTIDYGADRIEIGYGLREPEREWLAARLKDWQQEIATGSP